MITDILIIIIEIIITILIAFGVYYIQQKAKNQANKEDLQKITQIVEDVKQKYASENELLKSSLSLLTNKQNTLFTERKNAIIEFYSDLNKWIWNSLSISVQEYNYSNFTELSFRLLAIRDHYNATNLSFGKIQLFVTEEGLISAAHESVMETLKLHQFVENTIKDLQSVLSDGKILIDQLFSKEIKFDSLSADIKNIHERRANENSAKKTQILDSFSNKRQFLFNNVINKRNIYRDLAKAYLVK